ncbi:hypothetical protein J2S64_000420 [Paeniglutamicibacter sulfureus]|uniref:Uncharacterized protein n=1 Tax=Paeniglutamicibacter sulfureus TaxID=43666 RepID=A0ABU2BFH8_9MICC|nr:hypothetical protein [Paeniglutamicibacter sulfureus]
MAHRLGWPVHQRQHSMSRPGLGLPARCPSPIWRAPHFGHHRGAGIQLARKVARVATGPTHDAGSKSVSERNAEKPSPEIPVLTPLRWNG